MKSLYALLDTWGTAVAGTSHPQPPSYAGPDVTISGFVEHTGLVEPGKCFVARVRTGTDGHPYIGKAVAQGASLILGQRPAAELDVDFGDTPYLEVADTAVTLAWLSAAYYDFPGRQLVMIGVTGTDGKTTTSSLIYHVLKAAGLQTGLLSTIKAVIGQTEEPLALHVTTPEAPVVQRYLRRMVDAGLTHCVLETTSHSLAQHRVDGIDFDISVVTNITHEHLDYHGGYEGYFAAKARLFEALGLDALAVETHNPYKRRVVKTAVLNRDDSSYERLVTIDVPRRMSYGLYETADVTATDLRFSADATQYQLSLPGQNGNRELVHSHLVGEFNVYNMLAAAAVGEALGLSPAQVRDGLEAVQILTGRMEPVNEGQEFLVIVDFAHTPNGLAKAIGAAKGIAKGRVITVFGSAGKRDVEKRRMMAEISARDADLTVLTAEDPRTESLEDILAMMAAGCRSEGGVEGETFWRIPDRGRAIYFALSLAQLDDLVLICGKAHEQSMCFGTIEYPWDDLVATRTAIKAFREGEAMPDMGLPTF
ncbi:MAG: UDP-N-acetylmuramoyl-L-alanyl-D-glutamate--2,6-diaminopimelate ligase [Candidatus Promineifilaceae bacterium]